MDTAGLEEFSAMFDLYLRVSSGVMLCFNLNDEHTLELLTKYLDRVHEISVTDIPIMLVGCQNEEGKRQVTEEKIKQFQTEHNLPFYVEAPTKTGENVDDAFNALFYVVTLNEGFKDKVVDGKLKEQIGRPEVRERLEGLKQNGKKSHKKKGVPPCKTM